MGYKPNVLTPKPLLLPVYGECAQQDIKNIYFLLKVSDERSTALCIVHCKILLLKAILFAFSETLSEQFYKVLRTQALLWRFRKTTILV